MPKMGNSDESGRLSCYFMCGNLFQNTTPLKLQGDCEQIHIIFIPNLESFATERLFIPVTQSDAGIVWSKIYTIDFKRTAAGDIAFLEG